MKKKTEEILESIDFIQRASAPPFLYEKIKAKLRSCQPLFLENISRFIAKPVIAVSIICLIILGDIIAIKFSSNRNIGKPDNAVFSVSAEVNYTATAYYDLASSE